MQKLVVILGPTASGKSDLAVNLARRFSGEIISADSRQVYKGLNVGSGKITKKEMRGVPHHLLDVADPRRKFSAAKFQKLAFQAIGNIGKKEKLAFLVGGTGFYIQSVVDGIVIPDVPPNLKLRAQLGKKSVAQLFSMLQKSDPVRATTIDAKNPYRLIRAIEIIEATKKPVQPLKTNRQFDVLQIGIKKSPEELKKLIARRLQKRMPNMIAEVKKLWRGGLSFKRLEELGLEYRFVAQYLQQQFDREEMATLLQKEIEHYAKRQMTWFKRDKSIHWVRNRKESEKIIKKFL